MVVRLFLYNNECPPVLTPSAKVRYRSRAVTRLNDVTTLARVPSCRVEETEANTGYYESDPNYA